MKIAILGPPGSGKGTQAEKISEKFNLKYIDAGGILRKNKDIVVGGEKPRKFMEKGLLVPDFIVITLVIPHLKKSLKEGFVLDGFPRSLEQVKALKRLTSLDLVLFLDVSEDKIVKRISGREICLKCDISYHKTLKPPKRAGFCDVCGGKLVQRADDRAEVVRKRTKVFNESFRPVIKYYEEKGLLKKIDGNRSIKEVWKDIERELKKLE